MAEFVESVQPPIPREQKWVFIISTLFGCPVGCLMCDAGGGYRGRLSADEMFQQIDYLVRRRFPDGRVAVTMLKVQFARMGEPALNSAVLEVLEEFPDRYEAPGFMPSISTVAPKGSGAFLERLAELKNRHYGSGRFQLQFSLHSTDDDTRDRVIPVRKWSLADIASFGDRFYSAGDRKITLNFALAKHVALDASVLLRHFDPDRFLVKVTPLNPTYRAREYGLQSYIEPAAGERRYEKVDALRAAGYEVIVSIGELEENQIGSNCGQYLQRHVHATGKIDNGYTYDVEGR
jgi:23S rRNA (adenine2503-C2)-methyltransferase